MQAVRESRTIYGVKYTAQYCLDEEEADSAKFDLPGFLKHQVRHELDMAERVMICFHNGHNFIVDTILGDGEKCIYCKQDLLP